MADVLAEAVNTLRSELREIEVTTTELLAGVIELRDKVAALEYRVQRLEMAVGVAEESVEAKKSRRVKA